MATYDDVAVPARSKHDVVLQIEAGRRVEWVRVQHGAQVVYNVNARLLLLLLLMPQDVEVMNDAYIVVSVFLDEDGGAPKTDFQVPLSISGGWCTCGGCGISCNPHSMCISQART